MTLVLFFCHSVRYLPREVDPLVYNMSHEDPGNITYSEVGGLSEQIRELREVLEQVSIECRKTKTKVITLANHKGRIQSGKPIKTLSNYT